MSYEDHFSDRASLYARYRPRYPAALFGYLASVAPSRELAWDCGTGSGQAAVGLAEHFRHVIATDASEQQLIHARRHERVRYCVSAAEKTALPDRSVDVITAAQALHWFDLDAFYAEARRVLKPGGVLAAWCYHLTEGNPEVDGILTRFRNKVVGPYWSPRVRLANEHYRTIPFPFEELDPPAEFVAEAPWDLRDVLGYLESWSSTQKFIRECGFDPVERIRQDLAAAWGPPERRRCIRWPLYLRVGRSPASQVVGVGAVAQ